LLLAWLNVCSKLSKNEEKQRKQEIYEKKQENLNFLAGNVIIVVEYV